MAERVRLPPVDPEMKRWSAALEEELSSWPGVSSRPMFGMAGYYRDQSIFAAIPRTRAANTPFSLLIKLQPATRGRSGTIGSPAGGPIDRPRGGARATSHAGRQRIATSSGPGTGWVTFTLAAESDMAEALRLLGRAYERANVRTKRVRRP